MSVQRLGVDDLKRFRQMNALFGRAFEEPDIYGDSPPSDAYVQHLLEDVSFIALVMLEDDAVIGALAAYELKKFERERSEIYIYDLAVATAHRRKGVATALIEALKPIARACGADVIFVQADRDDPPAAALYEKLGRREDVLHFDISPGATSENQ